MIESELNDLVRDLGLSKSKAELLGLRLQQWNWNLVEDDVSVSVSRKLQKGLAPFFDVENTLVFCNYIGGFKYKLQTSGMEIVYRQLNIEFKGSTIAHWQYSSVGFLLDMQFT